MYCSSWLHFTLYSYTQGFLHRWIKVDSRGHLGQKDGHVRKLWADKFAQLWRSVWRIGMFNAVQQSGVGLNPGGNTVWYSTKWWRHFYLRSGQSSSLWCILALALYHPITHKLFRRLRSGIRAKTKVACREKRSAVVWCESPRGHGEICLRRSEKPLVGERAQPGML